MSVQITEEDFKEYVKVQKSGEYNMFDPRARELTDLSKEQWTKIMKHYKTFYEAWINNILKKKEDTNER
tara:strand:- start:1223 stop:1429 length:207 start_codon:yes stop_codon:yes gene_type:complete